MLDDENFVMSIDKIGDLDVSGENDLVYKSHFTLSVNRI
tara:strand:- start:230 stop:346 length:117 start_codon:yes stop_codon:yes gene_type:complete